MAKCCQCGKESQARWPAYVHVPLSQTPDPGQEAGQAQGPQTGGAKGRINASNRQPAACQGDTEGEIIMPKLKTHSGAKKRFSLTKSGKVKRAHAFKSHILTKKDTKRCRRLRSEAYADVTNEATIKKMIPYK